MLDSLPIDVMEVYAGVFVVATVVSFMVVILSEPNPKFLFVPLASGLVAAFLVINFVEEDEICRNTIVKATIEKEQVQLDGRECKYRKTLGDEFGKWIPKKSFTVREKIGD